VIKTHQSHHKTKFLIICNNPRIASTKAQSIFCNKTSFVKRQDSENMNISWYQYRDIWVFLKQKSVSKLLTFEKQKVMKFHEKLSRKRWQVINFFSPLSSQNSSQNVLELKPFNRFYIWYFETNISFQNSNTQTSFLKVSNNDRTRKLRKLTSLKSLHL